MTEAKQYEWYTLMIKYDTGWMLSIFKSIDKPHVIKQIEREVKATNSEKNLNLPSWKRKNVIKEVNWDTLKLDHVGYNRVY